MRDKKSILHNTNFKFIFFTFSSLLSLLIISFYTQYILDIKKQDALVINLAGRQTMIIQQYIKDLFYYLKTDKIEPVQKTIKVFEQTLFALSNGGSAPIDFESVNYIVIQKNNDKNIQKTLMTVEKEWLELKELAVSLIDDKNRTELNYKKLQNNVTELSAIMSKAVSLYQTSSEENLKRLKVSQITITVIAFLLFLISVHLFYRLEKFNQELGRMVEERTYELKETQKQLIEIAHRSGMSEIATGILHNVGNILNSVNISIELIINRIRNSGTSSLHNVLSLLTKNADNLGDFLTNNEKGRMLPAYLEELDKVIEKESKANLEESQKLSLNISNIINIVQLQQSLAGKGGVLEDISCEELIEQALKVNIEALKRHNIQIEKRYSHDIKIKVDRLKVMQILINLISNAKYAMNNNEQIKGKKLILSVNKISDAEKQYANITVTDNGSGIHPEIMKKIFQYGFTTKKDGHGFGLHTSSLSAKSMGGELIATSDGPQKGAAFTLKIPMNGEKNENG